MVQRRNGSPSILPLQRGTLIHHSRPRKGRLVKSAVLTRRVIKSRVNAVPRDIFCSAPPLGCGSVHVLGGSFARFCVSENVRVPLRYSGQPLHRKIIASRSPNTPWFCLSNRFFVNFNQAIDYKSIYAYSCQPKNYASNRSGHIRITDAPVSHTRYLGFFFSVNFVLVLLTAQNAKIFPPKRH